MHTQLVATELSNLGFNACLTTTGVLVWLNRKASKKEVEKALSQAFEGVQFQIELTERYYGKTTFHVTEE